MKKHMDAAGLEISDINEVLGVTESIFGIEWLEKASHKRTKDSNPFLQHPIFTACSSGSFMHLMEQVELCTYLVAFKNDPELHKIIAGLKDRSSYYDFLFHLAMAYRFKKLGFDVRLEPTIANDKSADFIACRGDLKIIGECTIAREWTVAMEERNAFFECQQAFKKVTYNLKRYVIVDIITKTSLKFDFINELKKDIIKAGYEFNKTGTTAIISNELYTVYISSMNDNIYKKLQSMETKKEVYEGWDQMVLFNLSTPKIPGDISTVDLTKPTPQSLLRHKSLVSAEEEFTYSLDDVIDDKVSGKFSQLKAHPSDHTSLLFLKVSDKLKKIDPQRVGMRLWSNIFQKVPSVNGVMLSERDWVGSKYEHQGIFFNNHNNSTNEHLFYAFNAVERDLDFVQEWRSVMGK